MLGQKARPSKLQKTEITQSMFFDPNGIKLEKKKVNIKKTISNV